MDAQFWTEIAQYGYWVTFFLAAAGTLYFVLERSTVAVSVRGVTTTGALVALITAFQYYDMRETVGWGSEFSFPTEMHYLGWILVVPMIVLMVQKFLGMKREGVVIRVMLASIVMVLAAWKTEFHGYDWTGFWISAVAWGYIAYCLNTKMTGKGDTWCHAKKIMMVGFAIIPLGALAFVTKADADIMALREVLYILFDVVVVLWLSHKLVTANRK